MSNPSINLKLNNNPACEVEIESTTKHEVWKLINKPFIMIEGNGFIDGTAKLTVVDRKNILFNGDIIITDGSFSIKFELTEILTNIEKLEVVINEYNFTIPVNLKKLFGTAKYFDGRPVKNPIVHCTYSDIFTIGDEAGNFELLLSSPEKQIAILDKSYSKQTLEPWLYNVNLHSNISLDVKMDKAEVYGIHMWEQELSDYIHFIPMSLSRSLEVMKKGYTNESDIILCEDTWPKLNREDIKIYSNDNPLDILSFAEVSDFIGYKDEKAVYRNSYVISIPKEDIKERIIKIVIKCSFFVNGQEIIDMGEGYYFMT